MRRWWCNLAPAAASLALGLGAGAAWAGGQSRGSAPAEELLTRLPVVPVAAAASSLEVARGGSGELAKYGLPGLSQLRSRDSYVLCYDPRARSALWVVERLDAAALRGSSERAACDFREDDSVHPYHRASNADYRGSGFDRGHLAAAANHKWSQKAMGDTFYLSNIAPQVSRELVGTDGCPPEPQAESGRSSSLDLLRYTFEFLTFYLPSNLVALTF